VSSFVAALLLTLTVVGTVFLSWRARLHRSLRLRRDMARRIHARLDYLRAMSRAMDEGVYTLDRSGRITYVNPAAERMLGYRQAELCGRTLKEALRCRRLEGVCSGRSCRLLGVMSSGEPFRGSDDLLTRKDGTCFPVRYSSAPLVRAGRVVGVVVVFQDITDEQRVAERERFLAGASAQLAESIEFEVTLARVARLSLPYLGDWCMVVLVDEDGTARRVAVESVDPARAEQARRMLEGYPIDLQAEHGVGRVLRTGEPELLPDVGDFVGGSGATVSTRAQLLADIGLRSFMAVPLRARGRTLGVIDFAVAESNRRFGPEDLAVAQELASRCALALDNARLLQRLEEAVRAREDTLAAVSHDLRNPLSTIRIAAGLVRRVGPGEGTAFGPRAAESIERACQRMNRLIEDLLDMSSIDAGRLSLVPARVDCGELVREPVEIVRGAAREAALDVAVGRAPAGAAVDADRDRILQVLLNLVSNAVKVTPPGGAISVGCAVEGDDALFTVADTGPGIAAEDLPHLFDRYWRGTQARYKGSGLGLSIARAIVEAHGGRIWAESRPGAGATFRFTIPLARGLGVPEGPGLFRDAAAAT
jgi:PAS domain S-box-containing protein